MKKYLLLLALAIQLAAATSQPSQAATFHHDCNGYCYNWMPDIVTATACFDGVIHEEHGLGACSNYSPQSDPVAAASCVTLNPKYDHILNCNSTECSVTGHITCPGGHKQEFSLSCPGNVNTGLPPRAEANSMGASCDNGNNFTPPSQEHAVACIGSMLFVLF